MASSSSLASFTYLFSLKTVKSMAALSSSPKTTIPCELKKRQNRLFHKLPSGLKMEVIEQRKCQAERENPPLVFVHGSYHSAWCWAEHWLPFFSSSAFDSYAVSLLGQGESDEALGTVAGTLETHASDIADFIESNLSSSRPVLIGHSFRGLIVRYYLANIANKKSLGTENAFPELSGAVLVCSVPPSGNSYQDLMKESSRMPLFDLRKLNASLPVPKLTGNSTKNIVLGAKDDFIVLKWFIDLPDNEGLMETGQFYDVEPVSIEGIAHDMMLDCSWKKGEVLSSWLCDLS